MAGFFKHPTVGEPLNNLVSILLHVSADDKVQKSPGDGERRPRVRKLQNSLLFLRKPAFDSSFVSCALLLQGSEVCCLSSMDIEEEARENGSELPTLKFGELDGFVSVPGTRIMARGGFSAAGRMRRGIPFPSTLSGILALLENSIRSL